VIKNFKSKGLAELWERGRTGKIDAKLQTRILRLLISIPCGASNRHAIRSTSTDRGVSHLSSKTATLAALTLSNITEEK
jgi:plasmid maintenance system killer protein